MKGSNSLIWVMFFCIGALFLLISSNGMGQGVNQKEKFNTTIANFFDLYNSGDTTAYRKFLEPISENEAKLKRTLTGFNNAYNMIGKVEVMKIQVNSPEHAEIWARDKKHDAWWKFEIFTDSLQRFKRRTVKPIPFEEYFVQNGSLTVDEIRDSIDQYINQKLSSEFKGNVFIAKGNEYLYTKSFGNNNEDQPNKFEQQFDLASMGKMFTAVSVLQLKEEGVLSLNDKVEKFVPELKNKPVGKITIKQLLTHTSGMGDFFEDPMYEKIKDSLRFPKDFMPFFEADKLSFEPGKDWRYSNSGFCLLALIIERASETSFDGYVRQNIFEKAFMRNSNVGSGAGGGLSTVNDLHKFSLALLRNNLLEKKTTEELLQFTVNGKYGYGTEHQLLAGENIVGHSGGFINVCTELNMYTNSGYIVIILSNSNPPFAHFLSNKIKELLVRH